MRVKPRLLPFIGFSLPLMFVANLMLNVSLSCVFAKQLAIIVQYTYQSETSKDEQYNFLIIFSILISFILFSLNFIEPMMSPSKHPNSILSSDNRHRPRTPRLDTCPATSFLGFNVAFFQFFQTSFLLSLFIHNLFVLFQLFLFSLTF